MLCLSFSYRFSFQVYLTDKDTILQQFEVAYKVDMPRHHFIKYMLQEDDTKSLEITIADHESVT